MIVNFKVESIMWYTILIGDYTLSATYQNQESITKIKGKKLNRKFFFKKNPTKLQKSK